MKFTRIRSYKERTSSKKPWRSARDGEDTSYKLAIRHADIISDILAAVTQAAGRVTRLQQVEPSLEEVFVDTVRKESNPDAVISLNSHA